MLKTTKILTILTALMLAGATLSACNTVDGAGQDIENAGETVQDAAN